MQLSDTRTKLSEATRRCREAQAATERKEKERLAAAKRAEALALRVRLARMRVKKKAGGAVTAASPLPCSPSLVRAPASRRQ